MFRSLMTVTVLAFSQGVFALSPALEAEAQKLNVPMQALATAVREAGSGAYSNHNMLAIFDLSQPSVNKRFYVIDLRAGTVSAYFASHGKGNGDNFKATRFKGFEDPNLNMIPLGPLRTDARVEDDADYETVVDQYDHGKTYRGLVILGLTGMTSYNRAYNRQSPTGWAILHSKWYVTEGYRKAFPGALGRSLGCIVLDPVYSNQVFEKLQGGALVYVTVGNTPPEKFL